MITAAAYFIPGKGSSVCREKNGIHSDLKNIELGTMVFDF